MVIDIFFYYIVEELLIEGNGDKSLLDCFVDLVIYFIFLGSSNRKFVGNIVLFMGFIILFVILNIVYWKIDIII